MKPIPYGPKPWHQAHWDARAAGNFIGGGAGTGLIVAGVLGGAQGVLLQGVLAAGLALIGLGLLCVWAEIGRPLRAINVFFNPGTSWMTREAFVAAWLFPIGAASILVLPSLAWATLALALAFLFCQSRMLPAARGIPAWRAPRLGPLVFATGLAEGAGLFVAASPWLGVPASIAAWLLGATVLLRLGLWFGYRRLGEASLVPRANAALDGAGRWLQAAGTALPLVAMAATIGDLALPPALEALAWTAAGLGATLSGSWFKFVLVTRAAYNQGFALKALPVRGQRHR